MVVLLATIAAAAGRNWDVITFLREAVEKGEVLSEEDRKLMENASKKQLSDLRKSLGVISAGAGNGNSKSAAALKAKIERDASNFADDVINFITKEIIPSTAHSKGALRFYRILLAYLRTFSSNSEIHALFAHQVALIAERKSKFALELIELLEKLPGKTEVTFRDPKNFTVKIRANLFSFQIPQSYPDAPPLVKIINQNQLHHLSCGPFQETVTEDGFVNLTWESSTTLLSAVREIFLLFV